MTFGSGRGTRQDKPGRKPGRAGEHPNKPYLRAVEARGPVTTADVAREPRFPAAAGILLGLGVGGFFDGIVLHQLLQWHHMLSRAGVPADTVEGLRVNTLADGLFHAATYVFVVAGLFLLWRAARRPHRRWPAAELVATLLIGFGTFNLVEGLVDHQILGIHHVNETVPPEYWLAWDMAFLGWGAAMLLAGLWLLRRTRGREEARAGT